jgi:hypothetical protein
VKAHGVVRCRGSRNFSRHWLTDGGKVVSLTRLPEDGHLKPKNLGQKKKLRLKYVTIDGILIFMQAQLNFFFLFFLHTDVVIIETVQRRCADENTILFLKVSNFDVRPFVRTSGFSRRTQFHGDSYLVTWTQSYHLTFPN